MALLFLKDRITSKSNWNGIPNPFGRRSGDRTGTSSVEYTSLRDVDAENGSVVSAPTEVGSDDQACAVRPRNEHHGGLTYDDDFGNEKSRDVLHDYFNNRSRFFFNLTLGLSDGLTVPFALTAGLTHFGDTAVVRYGGLAEVVAGCISMGIGGFMSSKGEVDAYRSELRNIRKIVHEEPERLSLLIHDIFSKYELSPLVLTGMIEHFQSSPEQAVDFVLRFHANLAVDSTSRLTSILAGMTISLGYGLGGMLPLLPYFMHSTLDVAFGWSLTIMIVVLLAFGFIRSWFTEGKSMISSVQSAVLFLLTGGAAVVAAMTCTKLIPHD